MRARGLLELWLFAVMLFLSATASASAQWTMTGPTPVVGQTYSRSAGVPIDKKVSWITSMTRPITDLDAEIYVYGVKRTVNKALNITSGVAGPTSWINIQGTVGALSQFPNVPADVRIIGTWVDAMGVTQKETWTIPIILGP